MKKALPLFVIILVTIVFVGCKSKPKIDNESAIELITKGLNLPIVNYGTFFSGNKSVGDGYTYKNDGSYIDPTYYLRNKFSFYGEIYLFKTGYREITAHIESHYLGPNDHGLPENLDMGGPMILSFRFTPQAEPYLKNTPENMNAWKTFHNNVMASIQLKTNEISFGNLISLRKVNESEYEVEFSLNVVNTPFGEALKQNRAWYKSGEFIEPIQFQKLKVKILKYEDGWKIATDDLSGLQKRL